MSWPEGSKDWKKIIEFIIMILPLIIKVFFGGNPGDKNE